MDAHPAGVRRGRDAVMFVHRQCSEREAGQWEDCAWCSGVMLENAAHGQNVAPSTQAEYQALRVAGGDGPAENPGDGSNNGQVRLGIMRRYHWTPNIIGPPVAPHPPWIEVLEHLAKPGDCGALQGSMGVWARTSHWRRWDAQFNGAHNVYVQRLDFERRLWWMNPQAPNSYPGEFISLDEAKRFYNGFIGGLLYAKVGQIVVAPPTDVGAPDHIGDKPPGATMWVETDRLARLFQPKPAEPTVLYPIPAPFPEAFTFEAWAGPNTTTTFTPGLGSNDKGTAVFRKVFGPGHKGQWIRVNPPDQGCTWHH